LSYFQIMKGIVAEGEELMPHRDSQVAPSTGENNRAEAEVPMPAESTPVNRREPEVPLATQSGRLNRPEPEAPLAAQSTLIKKLCKNQGLVLEDQTVTTGVQKVLDEETAPAEAHEDMEEKLEATVTQEFMKDKMVENRMEILTYKRRRLF
jgi:non-structural maintenance of chromosomes element 4